LREIWFCRLCMRVIEDTVRAAIQYRISEEMPK
jgi:hypothetical protein